MTYKSTGRRARRFDSSASKDERQGLAQRKRVVRAVAAVALAVMIVVGGGAFLVSDVFKVREGRVEGNEGLPAQGILAASGVMGQHWFLLNLDQSARSVKDLPGIDAANIRCEWQKECVVLVKVTQALARLDAPGATMWVDQSGRAQKTWDNARARVVVKLDDKALLPADGMAFDPGILSNLRELLEAQPDITQYAYTKADGFWFVNDRNWKVQIGTSGRAGAMIERSRMAQTLRDQLVSRNIQPKLIDVRVIEAPYYVK